MFVCFFKGIKIVRRELAQGLAETMTQWQQSNLHQAHNSKKRRGWNKSITADYMIQENEIKMEVNKSRNMSKDFKS